MSISIVQYPSIEEVKGIINGLKDIRVGILGDACIDVYWDADMTLSELSRETPHYPLPIVTEKISLGACANVAANAKALDCRSVTVLTVIGEDWRGLELIRIFKEQAIDTGNLILSQNRITPAYCKPIRRGVSDVVYEDPRLDFENRFVICSEDEERVIKQLNIMAEQVDVIAVSDQFNYGIITDKVRDKIREISLSGKTVVVDSRHRINKYRDVIIKPNEIECIRAVDPKGSLKAISYEDIYRAAERLYDYTNMPLAITYGSKGAIWYERDSITLAPTIPAEPPMDIVGAGDTFLSAFCCAYATERSGSKAIAFANIASSIVVKKIGTTGTATPREMLEKVGECNGK